jgi:Flp pilus assembly protein TadG
MTGPRHLLHRLRRDQRGVNIVEFGLIAGPFVMIILVILDFGYRLYLETVVEGTVNKAARRATIGGQSSTAIDDFVRSQLVAFSKRATITITKKSYGDFSGVNKAEKLTDDKNGNGTYDPGDCFEDAKVNGQYDSDAGKTGLGGSDDIVYYQVTVNFPRLVPLGKFLGFSNTETVTANTVLRNQPYGAQAQPNEICV